jgi:HAD superfamily hydrolase (TIGR01457 family)
LAPNTSAARSNRSAELPAATEDARPQVAPALADLRALVIDIDGVLWRGETPLPGMTEFFAFMRERSIAFRLATNNATQTPEMYIEKLARFGAQVDSSEVLTSALATAAYLKREAPGATAYVIGEAGIRQALRGAGLRVADEDDLTADIVVCSMDRGLTWSRLGNATINLRRGARFVATNADMTFPTERGITHGNGAILAALMAASGVEPTVVGKPEPLMYQMASQSMGVPAAQTAALGDRLETDILGAHRAGMPSILVLSGVASQADASGCPYPPTWTFLGLPELVQAWRRSAA